MKQHRPTAPNLPRIAQIWDDATAALTANKAARATAAKRSSGLTITNEE